MSKVVGHDKEPSFSIYEFKDWLEKQSDSSLQFPSLGKVYAKKVTGDSTGMHVQSRLGVPRLQEQIKKNNIDLPLQQVAVLAESFKESGGVITETHGLEVTVETRSGSFVLPKTYTKQSS